MASASEQAAPMPDPTTIYQQLESYNWDADEEFKSGLSAILGSGAPPEQAAELTLRARCFYFARKFNINVDFDGYKAWKAQQSAPAAWQVNGDPATAQPAAEDPPAGPKFSYQEIVEMIQKGTPIPGIKDIPDTVLEGQGTNSTKQTRRKPWEKDAPASEETPAQSTEAPASAEVSATP